MRREMGWLIFVLALWALVAVVGLSGCEDGPARGLNAIESQGFSDVTLGDYAWLGCGREDDLVRKHFTAKNVRGQRVEGLVCCGLGKGCTVRF